MGQPRAQQTNAVRVSSRIRCQCHFLAQVRILVAAMLCMMCWLSDMGICVRVPRNVPHLLLSGSDDGSFKIWNLTKFKAYV